MLQRTTPPAAVETGYRHDINGLRAVAVAAVILFHFGISGFSGGFVGVDVFFVISGYLMTEIISSRLVRGRFSLVGFYVARGRRIIPALAAMCVTIVGLGWLYLPTSELQELAGEARSALLFYSNELFLRQSGYFDKAAHSKWLLHTWSLSVEWQFYLLFPIILWAAWAVRPQRSTLAIVVASIFALSFGFLLVLPDSFGTFAFYSLSTRAWEMAGGGLVCLAAHRLKANGWLQIAGLALIAFSVFSFGQDPLWPGIKTVAPVFGAILIIAFGGTRSRLFSFGPVQYVGTTSYSLYLWHWPIVVGLNYFQMQSDPRAIAIGLVLTLVLASISYAVVEQSVRSGLQRGGNVLALVALVSIVGSGTYASQVSARFADRRPLPDSVRVAEQTAYDFNPRRPECLLFSGLDMPRCRYGSPDGKLAVIVYGDSHADAIVTSVAAALPAGSSVEEWSYASCPTIFDAKLVINDRPCNEFNVWAKDTLKSIDPAIPVIIVNRFSSYALGDEGLAKPYIYFSREVSHADEAFLSEYESHFVSTICEMAAQRPVYLLRPVPEMPYSVPPFLSRAAMVTSGATVSISRSAYDARHEFIVKAQNKAAEQCGAKILDVPKYLCTAESCAGNDGLTAFYFDNSHLSETGNRKLIQMFRSVFERPYETR